MPAAPRRIRRNGPERLAAWLATGPLGHLYGVVADLSGYAAGETARKARERVRGRGPRS